MIDKIRAKEIIEEGLSGLDLDGARVLVITPDDTRSGPMPLVFSLLADILLPRAKKLDFLVALGTHQPLSQEDINRHFGISPADRAGKYKNISIFNHDWQIPGTFKNIGVIPASEISKISGELLEQDVPVELNKLIYEYGHILIYGPVFPHEVAGFSAGYKYLFPGIAGPEIINITHWLGALITNYEIIGRAENPVRQVIERAADMVNMPILGIFAVMDDKHELSGLFAGTAREAWKKATELSARVNVKWLDRAYSRVISVMPEMYTDLWVGAKGMYKVEPVVEDNGEVIIYAPHIKEISFTHGAHILEVGYHVRDYFVKQWDRFKDYPWGVLAHSTHVKGMGKYENGIEKPRINVTLATGISKDICKRINLGYMNHREINPEDYDGDKDQDTLVVWSAGEILYRLAK